MRKGWYLEYTIKAELTNLKTIGIPIERRVSIPLYTKTEKGAISQAKKKWRGRDIGPLWPDIPGIFWTYLDKIVFSEPKVVYVKPLETSDFA